MKKYILLFALCIGAMQLFAEITLPAIIANNMVLQQKAEVKLWGTAKANKTITVQVSWNNKTYKTISDTNGNWLLNVQTPSAGGPYTISFSDGQKKTISNVMLGEVWLCAGQSNMEMPVKGYQGQPVSESQNTINKADASIPIRLFKVERNKSIHPTNEIKAVWHENNPESVKEFSAIAYYYASYIQSVLKVPIGIITSAWGGASIEAFMDSVTLSQFQKVNTQSKNTDILSYPKHCELYNGMIFPLRNITIKGVLWYQGETNAAQYNLYREQFPAMVSQWRKLWNVGDFPFYFAQIAPWKYKGVQATESARFREVQQLLSHEVPNSGMAPTVDTGDSLIIHPAAKKLIAERFACLALAKSYERKGLDFQAPTYKSMEIIKDTIQLNFNFAEDGIYSITKQIPGFEIAGSDKVFKPAKVELVKSRRIRLSESTISNPVAARYAFKNYSPVSLFSNLGLPLMPFRTDNWEEK